MKDSKLLTFLVALLASIVLWAYVVAVANPESTITIGDIPVTFSGEEVLQSDQNLIVSSGRDTTISATFSGKTSEMKKLQQSKDQITAVVDLTKIRSAKEYTLSYELRLPASVADSAVTVVDRKPASVTATVERFVTRQIEVRGDFSGLKAADGYILDGTSFDYDTVTVKGPDSVVNTIKAAQVILERTDLKRSFTENIDYVFVDQNGNAVDDENLTVDVANLELTVNVVLYKELPLSVSFIAGGGATEKDVSVEIEPATITISGDASVIESMNKIELANIDLATTPNSDELELPIILPDNTKSVSGEETATVALKIKNKETVTLRATNITFTHTADNLEVTSLTQQIQATIRADAAEIGQISSGNLRIVADMSDYTKTGMVTVPVKIVVDGFSSAGAVGEYSIAVSISEK